VNGGGVQKGDEYVVADLTRAELPSFQTCKRDAGKLSVSGCSACGAGAGGGGTSKRLGFAW